MVIVLAAAALAGTLLCAPGPAAPARLAALTPAPAGPRSSRWVPHTAVPVVLAAIGGLAVVGPGGAVAAGLVAAVVRHRLARRRARATGSIAAAELADAVGRMADELRSGAHPAAALDGVSGDAPRARAVLEPAAAAARLGDGVPAALLSASDREPGLAADLTRIAGAWTLADRHGVPLAELLAGAAADIAWRVRYGGQVDAQLAGPRATAAVLTGLPILGLALGQMIGADPVAVLRSGVLGQVLLVVGVALTAAGVAWTEHILHTAVPR